MNRCNEGHRKGPVDLQSILSRSGLLQRFENEKDPKLKTEIQKALEAISGKKDYKDEIRKWKVWWEVEATAFRKKKK